MKFSRFLDTRTSIFGRNPKLYHDVCAQFGAPTNQKWPQKPLQRCRDTIGARVCGLSAGASRGTKAENYSFLLVSFLFPSIGVCSLLCEANKAPHSRLFAISPCSIVSWSHQFEEKWTDVGTCTTSANLMCLSHVLFQMQKLRMHLYMHVTSYTKVTGIMQNGRDQSPSIIPKRHEVPEITRNGLGSKGPHKCSGHITFQHAYPTPSDPMTPFCSTNFITGNLNFGRQKMTRASLREEGSKASPSQQTHFS